MKNRGSEWLITSTREGDPERLSEVAMMSEDDEFTLDEVFGEDFNLEISNNPFESPHFVHSLEKVVIKNLEDILVLFHEASHGITNERDPIARKINSRLKGRIQDKGNLDDLDLEEIKELLLIRAERMASAYALKKIREIKKQKGIDLLEDQSFDSVRKRIHDGVESVFDKIQSTKEYKEKFNALQKALLKNKKRKNNESI